MWPIGTDWCDAQSPVCWTLRPNLQAFAYLLRWLWSTVDGELSGINVARGSRIWIMGERVRAGRIWRHRTSRKRLQFQGCQRQP